VRRLTRRPLALSRRRRALTRQPLVAVSVASLAVLTLFLGLVGFALVHRDDTEAGGPADEAALNAQAPLGVCGDLPTHAARETRGMTLTTVVNIDFPSQPGLDPETVRQEYLGWLDLAVAQRHNAIFVHIRPSGDAFWPSQYAPWSEWLTGTRDNADPGWDPLAFMIDEAHKRNIEFHGWFNPYRGDQPAPRGPGADINQLAPGHPLREHPEWAIVYPVGIAGANTSGDRLYIDPGNPDARRYIEDSMLEAVQNYDLDGVFFDDYFYPYKEGGQEFNDDASYAQYGGGLSRADWRRANVDTLVREMSERIKQLKPWVKFGINPFGIWRNASNDPELGSQTSGLSAYDELYADARKWVTEQWLDYIAPQLYWYIGFGPADYAILVAWWSQQIEGTRVQLWTGQGDYRAGESGTWSDPGELDRQLTLNQQYPVTGNVHYTAHSIRDDALGAITQYRDAHYFAPALPAVMPQLPAAPPPQPAILESTMDANGQVTLRWRGEGATSYAIYRYGDQASTAELVATVRSAGDGEQSIVDAPGGPGPYGYCVSGLDRSWNEGPASAPATAA
jgi:uncharacterized lipoprotein YddW (UPF0748 family)